nr:MAG TPA: hypothetical protein [Caudoviricetes sp.]
MKLTVEIDLMDLFSDYETDDWGDGKVESVGDTLKNELKRKVLSELSKKMLESYNEKLKNDLEPVYKEILDEVSEEIRKVSKEFITKKVSVTDRWGNIKKEDTSVLDLIKERIEETFDIKNSNSSFKKELNEIFGYELRNRINKTVSKVREEMEEKIKNETAEQIRRKIFEK